MKKITYILIFVLLLTLIPINASAEENDMLYLTKVDGIWESPYANQMTLITKGSAVTGLYYHKLYAEFDSDAGGFVITQKIPSHYNAEITVGRNAIGICFNYSPGTKAGAELAHKNFEVWCKLRVGDVLIPSDDDIIKGQLHLSGEWGSESFISTSTLTVKYNHETVNEPVTVAFGDSITSNGGWTEAVSDATGINIINSGVGGDRATEGIYRFENYVAKYSPKTVLMMYGTNEYCTYTDVSDVSKFAQNLRKLCRMCRDAGANVILMKPPYPKSTTMTDEKYNPDGGKVVFEKFLSAIETVASYENVPVIDLSEAFDGKDMDGYLCDTVHPNNKGYEIIAQAITGYFLDTKPVVEPITEKTETAAPETILPQTDTSANAVTETSDNQTNAEAPNGKKSLLVPLLITGACAAAFAVGAVLLIKYFKQKQ